MVRDTVILSIFFGTAGGLVYDTIYDKSATKQVYGQILLGTETPFKDIWGAGKTVVSDVYNNSPSKGAIGNLISTPAQAAWTAFQTVVSGTYLGVKTSCIDIYSGQKYVLSDILGEQSNLNGLGTGAVVAGILSIYSIATTPLLLISFGAAALTKSGTKYYTNLPISLSNKDINSSFNKFFNSLNEYKQSIFEEYKNEVFSFNAKNKAAFDNNKKALAEKYLEEIDEYVNKFNPGESDGFCDNSNKVNFFTVLHYVRKANKLQDNDVMSSNHKNIEQPGYKFYQKYYNNNNIKKTFTEICDLRNDLQKYKNDNHISKDSYQEICSRDKYSNEPLCSDFVKDAFFPELVDA
ncbi:hypothetical protein N3Z17_06010 [Candidatus Bandiella numerosa]|uniref:hypothetical protein n=1 Tax=Candidatus Bandiella numerosa TaxID=2570586 RepID=UPI00249DB013|nr:hypothetical protein [Candidatus Bandiella numerosa]WHA04772.1 hypothetical protein N3Z17_06010 [Candidatus Bandiella numerosa]